MERLDLEKQAKHPQLSSVTHGLARFGRVRPQDRRGGLCVWTTPAGPCAEGPCAPARMSTFAGQNGYAEPIGRFAK